MYCAGWGCVRVVANRVSDILGAGSLMTNEELLREVQQIASAQAAPRKARRGVFGKIIVLLCLLSGLGVCAAYFGFCWMSGEQPSEAIVAAMLAYTYGELWHCRKIKESKNKDGDK